MQYGQPPVAYAQPQVIVAAGPTGYHYTDPRATNLAHIKRVHSYHSVRLHCGHCGHEGMSHVDITNGAAVWATCLFFACFGCASCACCGFCITACKDAEHKCESCHKLVGHKRAIC